MKCARKTRVLAAIVCGLTVWLPSAAAQESFDFSDEALFGSADDFSDPDDAFFEDDGIEELQVPEDGPSDLSKGVLFDSGSIKVSGSFDMKASTYTTLYSPDDGLNFGERLRDTRFAPAADAMLSLDARPTQNLRMYTKFGIKFPYKDSISVDTAALAAMAGLNPANPLDRQGYYALLGNVISSSTIADWLYLKELFTDFNAGDRLFFRFGLHTVSWGAGFFFSPVSDMINTSSIDPENTSAQVNGSLNLRAQLTFPDSQNCLWFYVIPDSKVSTPSSSGTPLSVYLNSAQFPYSFKKTAFAAKADILVQNWELGVGAFFKLESAPRIMFTASGSVLDGKIGVFGEAVLRYGSDKQWTDSTDWGGKNLYFQGTIGGMYLWNDPKITFMAQYYFDSNEDDHEYTTFGHNIAATVNFGRIGTSDLTANVLGLFYLGKKSETELSKVISIYQSGRIYMPYAGIVSAMLTYSPFKNFSVSGGPYLTWLAMDRAPDVGLKLSVTLGGGKF